MTYYTMYGKCNSRVSLDLGYLRTFAPKSSYGEIFFISRLELGHKVLTTKMKKKMGVTDFVSEKWQWKNALRTVPTN